MGEVEVWVGDGLFLDEETVTVDDVVSVTFQRPLRMQTKFAYVSEGMKPDRSTFFNRAICNGTYCHWGCSYSIFYSFSDSRLSVYRF